MKPKLTYDFLPAADNGQRLAVDVPHNSWEQANARPAIEKSVSFLLNKRTNALVREIGDHSSRLIINDKRIGSSPRKTDLLSKVVQLLSNIEICTEQPDQDVTFKAQFRPHDINNIGCRPISMDIKWPNLADEPLRALVTRVMRTMAVNLKYLPPPELSQNVGAIMSRQHGVTLETLPGASCNVGTDGHLYAPSHSILHLESHNVYSNTQQLILLAGGVALARADNLVTS